MNLSGNGPDRKAGTLLPNKKSNFSPTQPHRNRHDNCLSVALIGAMIAVFQKYLRIVEMVKRMGNAAAEVKSARVLRIGRHGLRSNDVVENIAIDVPPSPSGLIDGARLKRPAGN
jgi:hypothetical protein